MTIKLRIAEFHPLRCGSDLALFVIVWNMLAAVLIGFMKFPRSILYITDLLNIYLFINAAYNVVRSRMFKIPVPLFFILVFALTGLISALVHHTSIALLLWGMRQNFRYFVFFFSCIVYLKQQDLERIIAIVRTVFWLSFPLCIYESVFVRYSADTIVGDMVGGIFYRIGSANAPLNIILVVYTAYVMTKCFAGEYPFWKMLVTTFAALIMAVLAEMKLFIIEVVVIALYSMIKNKMSVKTLVCLVFGILAFDFVVTMFVSVNARGRSYYTSDLFSLQSMVEYVTRSEGYDGVGDLNRFTAIPDLISRFFEDDVVGRMIGFGLGSAEYSKSFTALTSPFYRNYSYLHYQYFAHAFIFVETGLLGIISFTMIFVSALIKASRNLRKSPFKNFYVLICLLVLLLLFYNTTVRDEQCAYLIYALLAIPFARNFGYENKTIKEREV